MNVRITVLGLLLHRPMHGYEIQQLLQLSQAQQWADVLPGSIYHALKKMLAEDLVELHGDAPEGGRPRAVYAITPAGRGQFKAMLAELWRVPIRTVPSALYLAVTFLEHLPKTVVLAALDEQIEALERELEQAQEGERIKSSLPGAFPYLTAVFRNTYAHLNADLHLLRELRDTLPTAHLAPLQFSAPELPRRAATNEPQQTAQTRQEERT